MALFIVPVPIGNLGDITLRSIDVLKSVDFIIAEDTRYSIKLLNHLKIKKKMVSYYKPKEVQKSDQILKMLLKSNGALITDSGTPLISDPGYVIVRKVIDSGIELISLPGPTALIPALTLSGLDSSKFFFMGFPPKTEGKLRTFLESIKDVKNTIVFYESPRRTERFLRLSFEILGNRKFALIKELSKKNEKVIRGELKNYQNIVKNEKILGEIVLVYDGSSVDISKDAPEINSMEDIYRYFKKKYSIPKNRLKNKIMKKN